MSSTSKAVLLVADISGYTKFMKLHAVSMSHAKVIIVRLLKSLMQAARPPLKVAELEGDAVFFYAVSSEKDLKKTADQVKDQVVEFFSAFKAEIEKISKLNTCNCDACDHVTDLKLKQVVHVGDVAIEKIDRFEKLFGIDVILVHRMLKNSVPANEYVMMTDAVYSAIKDFFGIDPERRKETFDGVGEVETLVFYPGDIPEVSEGHRERIDGVSKGEKLAWRWKITWPALLELLGLKKVKGAFNNLPG